MASIYERMFGLKPCLTAGYPYGSKQGGGRMDPEVVDAMVEAAAYNVDMHRLLERAGEKIADMLGAEAAFITSGAAAALTLTSAAMMTGRDVTLMEQLPDTEYPVRMKNEIIMQRGHVTHYTGCLHAPGAKIVEVGCSYLPRGRAAGTSWEEFNESYQRATREGWIFYPLVFDEAKKKWVRVFKVLPMHIENAINERTAGIVYLRNAICVRGEYEVPLEEVVRIAKRHDVPVVCDFAPEGYKKSNFRMPLEKGVDLVIFSGGKDIRGPNDSGIVFGRKDLVEAVKLNSTPHYRFIVGRGFKVSREQIVGLVLALERRLAEDDEAVLKREIERCQYIANQFEGFPHVEASVYLPDDEVEGIMYYYPQVHLKVDEEALGVRAYEVGPELWASDPQVYLTSYLSPYGIVEITTRGLKDGEEDVVVAGIKRILSRNRR